MKEIKDRLTRFSGQAGTIYIGGDNELEINETRDRVVDALNSAKVAVKKGILPGGGSALLQSSKLLDFIETSNEDERQGVQLLKSTLRQPFK